MARWLREHLGFRSAKPAPPPDILAAYKLQRDRDFEDPYTGAGPGGLAPDARYGSPKHRLIKVDAAEKAPEEPAPEQVRAPRPAQDRPIPGWLAAECGSGARWLGWGVPRAIEPNSKPCICWKQLPARLCGCTRRSSTYVSALEPGTQVWYGRGREWG
uniref:Uncharacterized protein n=1 Tax=Chelydra serpentina TaxID=8475 RepID=A0A8C3XIX9_CHESE